MISTEMLSLNFILNQVHLPLLPWCLIMLNYLYEHEVSSFPISELYKFYPFNRDETLQYPGNVIQYGFIALAKVDTSRAYGGYSNAEWLDYKKNIFHKLCDLITVNGTKTFAAKDCAVTLHRIAQILTTDLKRMPIDLPQVAGLLSQL